MKKSIFQLIIILILIIGMVSTLLVITYRVNDSSHQNYKPIISDETDEEETAIDLTGYSKLEVIDKTFPQFKSLIKTSTYFDGEFSYNRFSLDTIYVTIGDKVSKDSLIGIKDDVEVYANCDGIVMSTDGEVVIRKHTELYCKFKYNIYDKTVYSIGDVFDVFKNGEKITEARITNIDYYNITDDYAEVVLQINNDTLYFQTQTEIFISLQGYTSVETKAVQSISVGVHLNDYQLLDRYIEGMYVENGDLKYVNIYLGISFSGYTQITEILSDGKGIEINEGTLYVNSSS